MISSSYTQSEDIEVSTSVSDKITRIISEYEFSEQEQYPAFASFSLYNLLEGFRDALGDPSSQAYEFFDFITTAEKENYPVVQRALYELFYDDYLSLFFEYLAGNSREISFDSLSDYLDYRSTEQRRLVKEKLLNETYKGYGNATMFLINNVLSDPSNRLLEFDSSLMENYRKFSVKPSVDYMENQAYRNLREAEEAYFSILEEFSVANGFGYTGANTYGMTFPVGYNMDLSKSILATLFNKEYGNRVKGTHLLMDTPSRKSGFTNDMEMNSDVFRVLSNDYKLMSREQFYEFYDSMVDEMVEYAKLNDLLWDEWEADDILESFLTQKLASLDSATATYTIDKLKELRFYKVFLARYLGVTTDSSFDKIDEITTEFDDLRVVLVSAGDYLRQEGFFI